VKPTICYNADETRRQVAAVTQRRDKLGIVPTMGALHPGHLSLVKASVSQCDFTVVTIFVNPTQFGPDEDYRQYPRDLDADYKLIEDTGADLIFAPSTEQLYGPRHSTFVEPPAVARSLEGAARPAHFRGVATIVLKLFNIVPANVAFFGQKDYQQTCVIRDMVADLDLPVSVQVCPIIREPDGLAMSSRNVYLSPEERTRAAAISAALRLAVAAFHDGETKPQAILAVMENHLRLAGIEEIDYVTLAHPVTLEPVTQVVSGTMALVAARVGQTRLIDNTRVG
jgi:pantoate--beta-alanine ligase